MHKKLTRRIYSSIGDQVKNYFKSFKLTDWPLLSKARHSMYWVLKEQSNTVDENLDKTKIILIANGKDPCMSLTYNIYLLACPNGLSKTLFWKL